MTDKVISCDKASHFHWSDNVKPLIGQSKSECLIYLNGYCHCGSFECGSVWHCLLFRHWLIFSFQTHDREIGGRGCTWWLGDTRTDTLWSAQPTCHNLETRIDQNLFSLLLKCRRQPEKVGVDKICKPLIRSLSKFSDMGDVQCSREQLSIFYLNS